MEQLLYERSTSFQDMLSRPCSGLPKAKCKAPRRIAEPRKGRLTKGGMLQKKLKKTGNFSIVIDVDVQSAWGFWQAGHVHDVTGKGNDKSGP